MSRKRVLIGVGALVVAVMVYLLFARDGARSAPGSESAAKAAAASASGSAASAAAAARRDPRRTAAGSLAGTVRDDAGAAIAGAWVCVRIAWEDDETSADDRREPRCTESGGDGGWKVEGLWAAKWVVTAGAAERIPATWRDPALGRGWLRLARGEARDGIDLVLDGGAALATGTVHDLTGGPVAGALVEVSPGTWNSDRGACITHSGDDGTFTCWVEPGEVWASAQADGYGSGWAQAIVPGSRFEIYLTPEATIGGVVVLADGGAPVAGARVQLAGEWGDGPSVYTDGQGGFRFSRIWPGRYKATASIPGAYGEAAESVLVGIAQSREDLVVELHPATIVTGRVVVEAAAGDPPGADGCSVGLARADGRRYDDRSEADGAVHFEAVQPGTYQVSVRCDRFISRPGYDELVVAAEPVERQWRVDAGLVLRGVVVDERGAPIARAGISARNVGGDPRGARGNAWETAGRDGRFEVHGLGAGTVEVSASSDRHVEDPEPMKLELAGDAEVTLRLATGGTIVGTVVDEAGAPVADARVHARGERWGGWGQNRDDGTFTMEGIAPGAYRVQASRGWGQSMRRPGSTDDDLQGERVTVRAGETTRVTLVVEGATGRITGRVVDALGRPVTDAFVKAERESEAAGRQRGGGLRGARWGWDERPAVTDLDGRFTLERLAPGSYTVLAYRRGGSDAHAEGVAVGGDVVLTIKPTASLAGTIDTGGAPPREVTVALSDPATGVDRRESFFLGGGAWVIRDLPAGSYDVSASAPEGSATLDDVGLAEGEAKTGLVLAVKRKVTITGRVVDADSGAPVAGIAVYASAVEGAGGGYSFTITGGGDQAHVSDAGGRFTVENVPQGRVRLSARPQDWGGSSPYARGGKLVTLGEGGPTDVGDVAVLKRRTARGKRGGDLGFTFEESPPDTDPAAVVLKVASIRAGGPAAGTGLVVGDVVVSVDGRDVRGEMSWQYWPTASVPEGTVVRIGLERGVTATIRAGPPE